MHWKTQKVPGYEWMGFTTDIQKNKAEPKTEYG